MSRRNATPAPDGTAATTAAVFGEVVGHLREASGLTQEDLAGKIPCDRSWIARVEAGTRVPQDTFATACDQLFGTGGMLARLWQRIDWYPQVEHPDWFKRRAEMDAEAVSLREYATQVVPGLLQTEDYARALFSQVATSYGNALVEKRVTARLSRQRRFLDPAGPLLVAVLDESSIRTVVGSGRGDARAVRPPPRNGSAAQHPHPASTVRAPLARTTHKTHDTDQTVRRP